MWAIRWSAQSRIRRSASQNRVSEGLWPGRCWTSRARSRRRSSSAVVKRPRHLGPRAPGAEAARNGAQRRDHVLGDPVAEHQRGRELVVELDVVAEVLDERDHDVDRRHLGSGARGDDLDQPQVVDVLVGEDDQLDLLERAPQGRELALELVERLAGVRPGVDQGQRLVLDQVAVDPPDRERGGDLKPVDAGLGRAFERLLRGHDRIRASTSSRFRSMSSRETSDSRLSRRSGSVFEGRTLKCHSG